MRDVPTKRTLGLFGTRYVNIRNFSGTQGMSLLLGV